MPAFHGNHPDAVLTSLYQQATVFALTPHEAASDAEGFGIVYLEAGAWRLPVVAGQGGGVGDAVVDGQTGLLVDPHDAGAIAEALCSLLSHRQRRDDLAACGQRHAGEHSWDRAAALLEQVVAERVAPSRQ